MSEPSPSSPDTAGVTGAVKAANGSVIAVAIGVMNVATYGFTIVAARALGPQQYGAFAAVMNLLLVVSVASLALQATAARRIASTPGDVSDIEDGVRHVTWRVALTLGAALVLAAPAINLLLRLESLATAALVGLIAVPLTVMGGLAGTLQGERRWRPLALLYVAAGVPRLAVGTAIIVWRPEEFTALLGVLLGSLAPVVVGMVALRNRGHRGHHERTDGDHGARALLRESVRNSQALLAFFAVTNIDVIMARNLLDDHDSGLYAGGLILTKAVLFLPQFVVVLAFPDMADSGERRRALRLSVSLVSILGVIGVLASYALSAVALVFVGGADYAEVQDKLWLFAVLGTLLSLIQLLVYALLAQEGGRAALLLWLALVVIGTLAASLADSVTTLLVIVTSVDALLFAALLFVVLGRPDREPAAA